MLERGVHSSLLADGGALPLSPCLPPSLSQREGVRWREREAGREREGERTCRRGSVGGGGVGVEARILELAEVFRDEVLAGWGRRPHPVFSNC